MEKIKTLIKETNGLAVLSFLTAIFAFVFIFTLQNCRGVQPSLFGFSAFITGIISLIWIKLKKEKGILFAILGIIIGAVLSTGFLDAAC